MIGGNSKFKKMVNFTLVTLTDHFDRCDRSLGLSKTYGVFHENNSNRYKNPLISSYSSEWKLISLLTSQIFTILRDLNLEERDYFELGELIAGGRYETM
jgi:hypothetical protein